MREEKMYTKWQIVLLVVIWIFVVIYTLAGLTVIFSIIYGSESYDFATTYESIMSDYKMTFIYFAGMICMLHIRNKILKSRYGDSEDKIIERNIVNLILILLPVFATLAVYIIFDTMFYFPKVGNNMVYPKANAESVQERLSGPMPKEIKYTFAEIKPEALGEKDVFKNY